MTSKKLNIKNLQATYNLPEVKLVPLEKVDSLNECRLYFDIFLAIALTFIGVILSNFNWVYFVVSSISLLLSLFFGIRAYIKYKRMREGI